MARISCQSQLILDTWRRYVAANWRFSRPRPLRERMKRKSCHGSPPGNASRRNTAMADSPKTHCGDILPLSDVGERIPLAFCHRRAPRGGASRRDLATAAPFKNTPRRHLAEKALGCLDLLRNRSGVRESEDVARTKRLPIQQRTPTRPRNHENILVPFAKKRHRKRTRVVWRA